MQPTLTDRRTGIALAALERLAVSEAAGFAASARVLVEVAALAERAGGLDGLDRCVELDLAGTLRTGQLGAARRLADAQRLVLVLPGVLGALETGVLLLPQARIVLTETAQCREDVAAEVARRVLALQDGPGGLAGWTSSRLTRKVKALVLAVEAELDAAETVRRQQRARSGRRVVVRSEPDGMASLWALLGAEQARVFAAGLDELSRRQRTADRLAGVDRTADQRRADLLAALPALVLHAQDGTLPPGLWPTDPTGAPVPPAGAPAPHPGATPASGACAFGGATGPGRGVPDLTASGLLGHPSVVVHVHVPVATALGLSHEPGVLAGYGPVDAAHVRLLLPTATLRRTLVDATTGTPLADDDHEDAAASTHAGSSTAAREPGASGRPAGSRRSGSTSPPGRQRRSQRRPPGRPPDGRPRTPQELEADLRALLPDTALWLADPDEPQHDPSAALTRLVQLRDPTCTGPGCSLPSDRCDTDHLQPWPTGPTAAGNLRPKSRRCHRAKTFTWTVTDHLTGDGTGTGSTTWTSPAGRTYTVPSPWDPPPEPLQRPVTTALPPDVLPPPIGSVERDLLDDLPPEPAPSPADSIPTGWPDDPGF